MRGRGVYQMIKLYRSLVVAVATFARVVWALISHGHTLNLLRQYGSFCGEREGGSEGADGVRVLHRPKLGCLR